ncbi:MAG: hypothetical protein JNK85_04280 [Verrucomicrobiales bacterium]|nr:hypothetical protein [Verrucomicrobiales bacterium]
MNARCLNDSGQVVGWANDGEPYDFLDDTAVFWDPRRGARVLQSLPGAVASLALALNNQGQAVGISGEPFPLSHPVVWRHASSDPVALPLPEGALGGMATGINAHGLVIGAIITSEGLASPLAWRNGQPALLPLNPANPNSEGWCFAVNDRGTVVGHIDGIPTAWINGSPVTLGSFGGAFGYASSINNRGLIAGSAETPDGNPHAYMWANGVMVRLGGDEPYSSALSLNNRGEIVGAAGLANLEGRAVLWTGTERVWLGDRIPSDSGWTLLEADCINDRGQITGIGYHDGQPRVFLLTPRSGLDRDACDDRIENP